MTILFYFNKFQYFYLDYFGFPISHAIWWKIHAAAKVNGFSCNKICSKTGARIKISMKCVGISIDCNNNTFLITASFKNELFISYKKIRIATVV